ncbi:hypothetical protein T484DRAFT_1751822 [Baffinella frigidus]|nr:hypothetical protein T484DRAFT_1751822 [Cryptophyta sp. CCMP2293]
MTKARLIRRSRRTHPRSRNRGLTTHIGKGGAKGGKDQCVVAPKPKPQRRKGVAGDVGRGRERGRGGDSQKRALLLDGEEDPFCTPFKMERICIVYEDAETVDADDLFAPRTPPGAPHRPATAEASPAYRPTRSTLNAVSVKLSSVAGFGWLPHPVEDLATLRVHSPHGSGGEHSYFYPEQRK